jgi:hypothetical protein
MKRDLIVAGKAVGGASLTGAVLYLVATVPTQVHVSRMSLDISDVTVSG